MTDDTEEQQQADQQSGDDGDNLLSDSIYGVLWSALEQGGAGVLGVGVHILLAHLLLPKHFGLIAMAGVAVSFIRLLEDQGFGVAIIQREDLEEMHLDVAFWTVLGVGLGLAGVGMLAAPWIALAFEEPKLEPILQVLLLTVPIASISSIPNAILKRDMKFKVLSVRSLAAAVVAGITAVILAFLDFGVWALVAQSLTSTVVGTAILWSAADWMPRFRYSKEHFKHLFSFGANITVQKMMNFVNRQSDDLIIGYFLGAQALGYYTIAYEILKGMTDLFSRSMTNVALPTFSKMQDDIGRLRRSFMAAVRMTAVVTFPIFLLYIALAPEMFDVVYGDKWAPAIPTAQVLGGIGLLHSLALFNPPVLKALGKPSWEMGLSTLNVIGNVTGFLIAAQFGIVWVAAAYVIRGYLFTPIELYLVRKLIDYRATTYAKNLLFPLLGCGLMLGAVFAVKTFLPENFAALPVFGICLVVGIGTYLLYAYLFLPDAVRQVITNVREEMA